MHYKRIELWIGFKEYPISYSRYYLMLQSVQPEQRPAGLPPPPLQQDLLRQAQRHGGLSVQGEKRLCLYVCVCLYNLTP